MINGDDGDDSIYNEGTSVTIYGGAGNDSIRNKGTSAGIYGGEDDDTVRLTIEFTIFINRLGMLISKYMKKSLLPIT